MKNKIFVGIIVFFSIFIIGCGEKEEAVEQEDAVVPAVKEMSDDDFVAIYSSLILAGVIEKNREKEVEGSPALADTLAAYGYSQESLTHFIDKLWLDPMRWDRLMSEIEEQVMEKQ